MRDSQSWFAVTLIFCSEIEGITNLRPLCEERVVLFRSPDEKAASLAANRYGGAEEHGYRNTDGETVKWIFVGIEKIVELDDESELGWVVSARYTRRLLRTLKAMRDDSNRRA